MMTRRRPRQEVSVSQTAAVLRRLGLRTPAIIALDAGRPLAFVAGQLLWIIQPALGLLFPNNKLDHVAQLLESPQAVDALIRHLEENEA